MEGRKTVATMNVLLSTESRGCQFEIWLDIQLNYAVKRFSFYAEKGNKFAHGVGRYHYEVNEFGSKEELYFPRKITTEISEHEREAMISVPGGEPEKSIIRGRKIKNEINFYDVEVNPKLIESSFRLKKEPENYTEVVVLNKFQIQHIWLDDKVVPLTDEIALARARGHGFVPGVREPRFWLMVIGAAMVLFALGIKIYRYFSPKGDDQ